MRFRLRDMLGSAKMHGVEIVGERPPVWDSVCAVIGGRPEHAIFAYDGKIYNPGRRVIDRAAVEHEKLHFEQQKECGGADLWWGKWLRDPKFRLDQEARGYGVQYRVATRGRGDGDLLGRMAGSLAGPIYGGCITEAEARLLIRQHAGI